MKQVDFSTQLIHCFDKALRQCDLAVLKKLVAEHPNLQHANRQWMHVAALSDSPELIRFLHTCGVALEHHNTVGATPLYETVSARRWGQARVLLELGANANFRKATASTMLHRAAELQDGYEIIPDLAMHGADLNSRSNPVKEPPLFRAIRRGWIQNIRTLLVLGVDYNMRASGFTAAEFASNWRRKDIAQEIQAWAQANTAQQVVAEVASKNSSALRPLDS